MFLCLAGAMFTSIECVECLEREEQCHVHPESSVDLLEFRWLCEEQEQRYDR